MADRTDTQLTVSIIVPVFKNSPEFEACAASLAALDPSPSEIIIVADGSVSEVMDLATTLGFRLVPIAGPAGPAIARNAGADAASGEILFFVDGDVALPPDAVRRLSDIFRREPGLAAVIGSYDDAPAAAGFIAQYRNLLHHYVHQTGSVDAFTFWGACGGIRREVFIRSGGFSTRYPKPSIEDIELGYRLRLAGSRIRLEKSLQVKHLKSWSLISMVRTDLFYRAIPWTALILQARRVVNDLNLRAENRASVALVSLAVLLIMASPWLPALLLGAAAALVVIAVLNLPLYRFFAQKRGLWFALGVIPLNLLYHLCSAVGFVIGIILYAMAAFTRRQIDWAPSSNHSMSTEETLKS